MDLSERGTATQRHPWELARSIFFKRLIVDKALDTRSARSEPMRILDIGAGDGWFAQELINDLPETADITCWDINYTFDDLNEALPPRVHRTTQRPLGSFDLILMLDVLEHIPDDNQFLAESVVPMLASTGSFVLSVPAHQWLFSSHDVALGHYRRYPPAVISELLGRHFHLVSEGSLFASLVPIRGVQKLVEMVTRNASHGMDQLPTNQPAADQHGEEEAIGLAKWRLGGSATSVVTSVLAADGRLARALARRGRRLPGLSYWAVCTAIVPALA